MQAQLPRTPFNAAKIERCRQRFADENSFTWHLHAFPVRLDQGRTAQIVRHHDPRIGKLRRPCTGLNDSAETPRRARFQPAQRAHLFAVGQLAPRRGEMIADGTWQKLQGIEAFDADATGEVEHHIVAPDQRVVPDYFSGQQRIEQTLDVCVSRSAYVARLVRGADQVSSAARTTAVAGNAAIDERLGGGKICGREAHGRAEFEIIERVCAVAGEIGRWLRYRAGLSGTPALVEAEGEGRSDGHAADPIGLGPGQGVGLYLRGRRRVDVSLDTVEFIHGQRRASRCEAHMDKIRLRYPAPLHVVVGDLSTERIGIVDDDREFGGTDAVLRQKDLRFVYCMDRRCDDDEVDN